MFKEDIHLKYRQGRPYKFIGLDGKPAQIVLESDEKLIETRCPVDGCFIKRYDPRKDHEPTVQECPCCGYDPRTDLGIFGESIASKAYHGSEEDVARALAWTRLFMNRQSPIKQANLQNSLYSN